jgi:hypothetical protein
MENGYKDFVNKNKKLLIGVAILIITFIMFHLPNSRDYRLTVCNGSGLTYMETFIYCDSFEMISTKEVKFWVDGKEQTVLATDCIRIETN